MSRSIDNTTTSTHWQLHAGSLLAIGMIVLIAHGWSLGDGLFLDDHWHQVQLYRGGWSVHDLMSAATIEPSCFIHAWWQDQPVRWDYCRPLAMLWMKSMQHLTRGSAPLLHVSSLLWHYVCCVLVYLLAIEVTRQRFWSACAASLFAVYPHSVVTVGWLAAQNAILQTALTLAAMLLYLRLADPQPRAGGPTGAGSARMQFAAVVLLFVVSLFTRENAVVFPFLALSADAAYGGRRRLFARWKGHVVLFAIAGVFCWWRLQAFDSHIPDTYLRRPQSLGDVWWFLGKLLHYVVCTIWEAPMFIGPQQDGNPFVDRPADTFLMVGILVVLAAGYVIACHGTVRGYWFWPVWILSAVLPVVPILATPHSGYMAGVGLVMALVLKPAVPGKAPFSIAACLWFALMSAFALIVYRNVWRGVVRAEQYVNGAMIAQDEPPENADLFFINLPLANIYLPVVLQQAWHRSPQALRGHVLTYAPHLLMGPEHCTVEQNSAHAFTVTIENDRYFSGLLGRFLAGDMRRAGRFQAGETLHDEWFEVRILQADDQGVSKLRFTFKEALSAEPFRFYIVTRDCGAKELRFSGDWLTEPGRSERLVYHAAPCAGLEDLRGRRQRLLRILDVARRIIRTDLYLTGSDGELRKER